MTEQAFKVGDEVWYLSNHPSISLIGSVTRIYKDGGVLLSNGSTVFSGFRRYYFPSREAAKAALIEKLEAALEEAKGL